MRISCRCSGRKWRFDRSFPVPKLPGIGQRDAVRVLEKRGFRIVRQGKHITLSDGAVFVQVPRHNPINAFTMGYIAQVAGMTPAQFRELL